MQLALLAFLPEIDPKTSDSGRSWTRFRSQSGVLDADGIHDRGRKGT